MGYKREDSATDGIVKDGKNINVSLIFMARDNRDRFQSEVIDLMSVVAGHKRPLIEVDDATAPHDIILRSERTERLSIADTVLLSRVFRYQYDHDCTNDDVDNSAECDGYSDVASLRSTAFGEYASIENPEVQMQMIEDPRSDYWDSTAPEKAHIKDKAKCTKSDKTDPNNLIYMSRFLHCYFDGLNSKPARFPLMKIHFVAHDAEAVQCSAIIADCPLGLQPRTRAVVHLIFWSASVRKYAMAFLRAGGRNVDAVTYELDLYFVDVNKAATFLKWKEEQTERAWIARRRGVSAAQVAVAEHIDQGNEEEDDDGA